MNTDYIICSINQHFPFWNKCQLFFGFDDGKNFLS